MITKDKVTVFFFYVGPFPFIFDNREKRTNRYKICFKIFNKKTNNKGNKTFHSIKHIS